MGRLRPLLAGVALMALAGSAVAQVSWHSPFPRPRPVQPGATPMSMPMTAMPSTDIAVAQAMGLAAQLPGPASDSAGDLGSGLVRSLVPRARSARAAARFAAAQSTRVTSARRSNAPSTAGPVERGLCGVRAIEGRRLPRITSSTNGCGISAPVSVTSVHGIPLSRGARLDCDLARAFAEWVDDSLVPAVGRRGGGVAQIRMIGDYSCRTRNNRPGARISEHGRGMAIDIAGYQLVNGDVVTVENHWRRRPHSSDLHDMYEEACDIFRTTLSPDADRYHQDHFHFDLAQHRGGGSYCR